MFSLKWIAAALHSSLKCLAQTQMLHFMRDRETDAESSSSLVTVRVSESESDISVFSLGNETCMH